MANFDAKYQKLKSDFQSAITDNSELINYCKELETELQSIQSKPPPSKSIQSPQNKVNIKSTHSLTYSPDIPSPPSPSLSKSSKFHIPSSTQENVHSNIPQPQSQLSVQTVKKYDHQILSLEHRHKIHTLQSELLTSQQSIKNLKLQNVLISDKLEAMKKLNIKLGGSRGKQGKKTETNMQFYIEKLEVDNIELNEKVDELNKECDRYKEEMERTIEEVSKIQQDNLRLLMKVKEDGVDEKEMVDVLSERVREQKQQIRELMGEVERLRNTRDDKS